MSQKLVLNACSTLIITGCSYLRTYLPTDKTSWARSVEYRLLMKKTHESYLLVVVDKNYYGYLD